MRILVFGLGYVGVTSVACLSGEGHRVTGIDVAEAKVAQLNAGRSPIVEPLIGEKILSALRDGRLDALQDPQNVLQDADLCIICVGTPSEANGSVRTAAVENVVRQLGSHRRRTGAAPVIAVRSTIPIGTMELLSAEYRESSGSADAPLVFHPEFMREGVAVSDYYSPPKIVVGEAMAGSQAGDLVCSLYRSIEAPIFRTSYGEAEMVKYCDNTFHALKIAFANEVGLVARSYAVDSRKVMQIFCADKKLNISDKYLKPGFAFGGSCLPKDLRGLLAMSRKSDIELPVVSSILTSNALLIERAVTEILALGHRRIGLWGLAFKPGTDDLRESPLVLLAERLLGKGVDLAIFDSSVERSLLVGGNEAYVAAHLPHLEKLLVRDASSLDQCPLIVAGHSMEPTTLDRWLANGCAVYDLVGALPRASWSSHYQAIT